LAFGAILEGPGGFLQTLITQAIPVLVNHLRSDPVVYVKDTTAWTLGRVCQLHSSTVVPFLNEVISTFAISLADSPRVASNVCWAIHNLALSFEEESDKNTSPLSPYFQGILEKLLLTTEREDADENNLRVSAYEAMNVLIQNSAKDTQHIVLKVLPVFIDRLAKTFTMQVVSSDDREEITELQSLLCGVLQVIIQKSGGDIKPNADKMMQLFLQVFSSKSASVHEEALMAVGAIANAVEGDFEKYMPHFRPFLTLGLRNYEEHQVCAVAVGVVGDISRALGPKLLPYCDEIVSLLLQDLQNPVLNRNVKPPILSCFGDIALAIGGEFVKYLSIVMNMLQQASTTTLDMNDYDLVDYLNQLREGIFEAYTGIIQGLRTDGMADPHFVPYAAHVINFVGFVFSDNTRTDSVTRGAVGVLGDLAHALGGQVKQPLQAPFVKELLTECMNPENPQTADVAQWARDVINAL
jgi:importin subunit beta-1